MHRPLWNERYQPSDAEIIKKKARKMVGHYGYRTCDVVDLEQELALHMVQQMRLYRPGRGTRAQFVNRIAKNKLLNIIERRTAQKRDDRRNVAIEKAGDHSSAFPNSGTLVTSLGDFHKRLHRLTKHDHAVPLISIVADIAYRNPRTYSICAAILSKLISLIVDLAERNEALAKIIKRFQTIPNTGHMLLWLQRICLPLGYNTSFTEPLCLLAERKDAEIWNCEWVKSSGVLEAIDPTSIIDQDAIQSLQAVISPKEIELFAWNNEYFV